MLCWKGDRIHSSSKYTSIKNSGRVNKMNFLLRATFAALVFTACDAQAATSSGCATLAGPATTAAASGTASGMLQGFKVRDGEPVDLVSGARRVHGTLLVFGGNGAYRAYWQPENSAEKYVLANAGDNAIRLVSTPPQGTPVKNGEPGTALAPQTVLSCPTL
jgi:hypothetical protein